MIFIIFHSDDFSFKQAERQGSARVLCFRRGLNRPACMGFGYSERQSFSFAQGNTKGQPWRPCP